MRRLAALSCLAIAVMVLGVGLAGCGSSAGELAGSASASAADASSGFAAGDSVAATWTDGNLYLANVTAVDGDEVTVTFVDDGSSLAVAAAGVRTIPETAFAVGDRVLAVWQNGRFYPAEISAADGSTYTVAWDDGSEPSPVEAGRIIAE
jgi:hypothetical protein